MYFAFDGSNEDASQHNVDILQKQAMIVIALGIAQQIQERRTKQKTLTPLQR
jgi:hypothetical protein